jgi:hypothetical protein
LPLPLNPLVIWTPNSPSVVLAIHWQSRRGEHFDDTRAAGCRVGRRLRNCCVSASTVASLHDGMSDMPAYCHVARLVTSIIDPLASVALANSCRVWPGASIEPASFATATSTCLTVCVGAGGACLSPQAPVSAERSTQVNTTARRPVAIEVSVVLSESVPYSSAGIAGFDAEQRE